MSLEYVYSAGTISVGSNSTSVTGVGTQFVAAGIREGDDFRANGLVATIASVNSNTSITLANGWPGSSISSGDYSIRQYDNADRALPAFNSLLLALGSGNLTSLAGLTGAANQMPYWTGAGVFNTTGLTSAARTFLASSLLSVSGNNLVTTSAARLTGGAVTQSDTDTTAGRVPIVGWMGLGVTVSQPIWPNTSINDVTGVGSGIYRTVGATTDIPAGPSVVYFGRRFTDGGQFTQVIIVTSAPSQDIWYRVSYGGSEASPTWGPWQKAYSTNNTTVDSNGFVKEASPIVRLHNGRTEEPVEHVGATMTRHGTGSYTLSGVPPLATEGWQIEVPQDHNGNRLVFVEVTYDEQAETLTVTTSKPVWSMETMSWAAGGPVDIPEGRWVDLRFWKEPAQEEDPEEE